MAITLYDCLTFPFNSGRGIKASQIDGGGMQTYFAVDSAWDSASNPTELRLSGFAGPHGLGDIVGQRSIILFRAPATTPRGATELTARVGTVSGLRVRDLHDGVLRARDLTPNALYEAFYSAGSPGTLLWVEPIIPRPQDFNIVVARVYEPYTTPNIEAQLSAGAPYSTGDVLSPADTMPGVVNSLAFGVPSFAPDIDRVFPLIPLGVTGYSVNGPNTAIFTPIGGVPYKWWFGSSWLAGRDFRVTFLEYS